MRQTRVVLVGAGTRARKLYLPWLARGEGSAMAVLAVLDRDQEAAAGAALQCGPRVASGGPELLSALLGMGEADLVVVATPDHTHAGLVCQALQHDTDVLVEKPLTTTLSDARDVVRAAQRSAGRVWVAHNLRFTNLHLRVRDLITSGALGRIAGMTFDYALRPEHGYSYYTRWHRRTAASGGLEVTKATHHFDLLAWWLQGHAVAVTGAQRRNFYHPGATAEHPPGAVVPADADIHDTVTALLEYDTGTVVQYSLTAAGPVEGYSCTIRGTEATCTFRYDAHAVSGEPASRSAFVVRVQPIGTGAAGQVHEETVRREDGTHAGADTRMLRCLAQHRTELFATAADAAAVVGLGEALRISAAKGERQLVASFAQIAGVGR